MAKIGNRHYNPYQSPYNKKYKEVLEYAEKYGLDTPERVNEPTLEDIEELRHFQEGQTEKAQEVRDIYKIACEAIDAVLSKIKPTTSWEAVKYNHAEDEVKDAKEANLNNREWAQAVIDSTAEILNDLEGFVYISTQTWDKNTPHESTYFWDLFFSYIWGIA